MKTHIALAFLLATSTALLAADTTVKDDVKGATDKLGAAASYAWTTTTESSMFKPGPSHGKTEKGGYTYVDFSFNDNTTETIFNEGKGAIKTDEGWATLEEAAKDDGNGGFNPRAFLARMVQNYKAPVAEVQDLIGNAKDLVKTNDMYAGNLTEEGAQSKMRFGRRGQGPEIKDAKGTLKVWIKDGVLSKYEFSLSGSMKNQDGDDMTIDRTTTVEIKDVGTTKIAIPEDAKKKLL